MAWTSRDITVAEAARYAGLPRASLDVIVSRAKDCEVLFSEKRRHRRWFSQRDICVLRIAFELERAGRSWLMALATAYDHLEHPPDPEALLVAPAVIRRGCGRPRIISDRDAGRLLFDVSKIVIPIGRICHDIIQKTEADLVAV